MLRLPERQGSMDKTLQTVLTAIERLDARAVSDRVAALEALGSEIPQLLQLPSEAWDLKLAEIEEDVADLAEKAERAAAIHEQAHRVLETLSHLAGRSKPKDHDERQLADANGRYENEIAQAETTREAILRVMLRRPARQ